MRTSILSVICLILLAFTACQSKKNKNEDGGYCSELDTTYKRNSIEIESISRTFYKKGDILGDCIQLKQTLGDSSIYLIVNNNNGDFGVSMLSSNDISALFANMRTVASNYTKNLSFDIGDSILNGSVSNGVQSNSVSIMVLQSSQTKPVLSMDLLPADIDSMEAAYSRFVSE